VLFRSIRSAFKSADGAPPADTRPVAFDDPRRDAVSLAWARAVLGAGDWSDGYARLVRLADGPRRPGFWPGASVAAVERGEAGQAPAAEPPAGSVLGPLAVFAHVTGWPDWVEGAAAVRGAPHEAAALSFLDHLARAGVTGPAPDDPMPPAADSLLADLLGSTLVEPREELRAAWSALDAAGRPGRAAGWLTQAPPWPPASVAALRKGGPASKALLETLAVQVAPEADARAWLLRSWVAPERPVDGSLLSGIARAADGRLAREPRFRAWLRSEWTAWARQRYRRVARSASGGFEPAAVREEQGGGS
jgi:hypothetical protein